MSLRILKAVESNNFSVLYIVLLFLNTGIQFSGFSFVSDWRYFFLVYLWRRAGHRLDMLGADENRT
jgi:hypothetical protein